MSLIRLFSDFDGRIGLRTFWLGSIAVALTLLAIQRTVPLLVGYRDAIMIVAFVKAFALFPWAALAAKRATDRGLRDRAAGASARRHAVRLAPVAGGDLDHGLGRRLHRSRAAAVGSEAG